MNSMNCTHMLLEKCLAIRLFLNENAKFSTQCCLIWPWKSCQVFFLFVLHGSCQFWPQNDVLVFPFFQGPFLWAQSSFFLVPGPESSPKWGFLLLLLLPLEVVPCIMLPRAHFRCQSDGIEQRLTWTHSGLAEALMRVTITKYNCLLSRLLQSFFESNIFLPLVGSFLQISESFSYLATYLLGWFTFSNSVNFPGSSWLFWIFGTHKVQKCQF